jgi:hypothetical protein
MARIWLSVTEFHDGPGFGHPQELWWRDVDIEGAPDRGDEYSFLASETDPDGTCTTEVRARYWDINGRLNIELRRIVHLPNEDMEREITVRARQHDSTEDYIRRTPMPWRASDDEGSGVLDEQLAWSGWKRYSELER